MLLSLAASSRAPEPCVDSWLLITLIVLAIIGAVALCRYFVFCLQRGFEVTCDWLEAKLVTRKMRRQRTLSRYGTSASQTIQLSATDNNYPPLTAVPKVKSKRSIVAPFKPPIVNAQDALRRSCSPPNSAA